MTCAHCVVPDGVDPREDYDDLGHEQTLSHRAIQLNYADDISDLESDIKRHESDQKLAQFTLEVDRIKLIGFC